ncbi:single-stranded DNA-binding protein [Clostridium botulinum]|uniref:Single-stranded DNA-binding protein n=1 Tax=Clostridium botulinum TaxID=1491 RepID=A0A6B4JHN5_CLOBO|nr:single-stranded DNA-binding protein [Clostridium botulinum]EES49728.1 single-strand binding protein [Clostridium botulinum E1 str. 'BoNT E Beluga']MBY6759699.1 single-stranded DNA-binding protein [Clostridium botulinum]MBY6918607.1 single-stranded DNA-binding protein [Clostridium botulinum]MCR1129690.1 single-stranded DNA-binding protein [Clostridium botulinum]NFJ56423.1 single-stranded DNA-binding protein [Clostridium botulinum]
MNRVQLIGRMTKDPELRFTPGNGKAVANFSIAVEDGFGDNKKAYFINIVVWGKSAEALANYTHKGSKIAVSGKLTVRDYEAKDGTKRYATEVVADMYGGIEFLDNKNDNNQSNVGSYSNEYLAPQNNSFYGENFDADITPVDDGDMPF